MTTDKNKELAHHTFAVALENGYEIHQAKEIHDFVLTAVQRQREQ